MRNRVGVTVGVVLLLALNALPSHAQRLTRRPGWVMLALSAPKLDYPIRDNPNPGCIGSANMGQMLDDFLKRALAAPDGVGEDSTWSGTSASDAQSIDVGGRRYSQYATCRIFALTVPVPLGSIKKISTVMHIDKKPNSEDNVCHPLQLKKQGNNWILEAVPPYPTPGTVGCSGGHSLFETFKAIQSSDGKTSVLGAVFKNWSHETMRTGQFIVEW